MGNIRQAAELLFKGTTFVEVRHVLRERPVKQHHRRFEVIGGCARAANGVLVLVRQLLITS